MSVDVPRCFCDRSGVELNEQQRLALGAALIDVRTLRFKGSRKAAYTAAGVNPATWTRVESGEPIKEASLAKIVANLFPSTRGDWRALFDGDTVVVPQDDMPETADPERLDMAFELIGEVFKQLEQIQDRLDALGAPRAQLSVADAARDVGRRGSLARARDAQDEAGEPLTDDTDDMEPR